MPKGSMYTESYLDFQDIEKPITPGTFLSRQLKGTAAKYKMRYLAVLLRDLESRKNVKKVKSVGNAVAYIKTEN